MINLSSLSEKEIKKRFLFISPDVYYDKDTKQVYENLTADQDLPNGKLGKIMMLIFGVLFLIGFLPVLMTISRHSGINFSMLMKQPMNQWFYGKTKAILATIVYYVLLSIPVYVIYKEMVATRLTQSSQLKLITDKNEKIKDAKSMLFTMDIVPIASGVALLVISLIMYPDTIEQNFMTSWLLFGLFIWLPLIVIMKTFVIDKAFFKLKVIKPYLPEREATPSDDESTSEE